MTASLLAAGLWLLIATKRGWPVSTTHAVAGGIVGAFSRREIDRIIAAHGVKL